MLYASLAIIAAGIVGALAPLVWEWHRNRQEKERDRQ
jgi:hypothetical protein